ncbi:TPA: HDOD domain-containing protein, partial [Aeromonas hydrophila]
MEAASAMSMDRLFDKIKQLPTIPQLLHELMQSFSDENARIDEIAAKIAMDQVISVKVLRMANSAALRRGNEVTSIEQAVIRLGFNRLRSVVVASGIIGSFKAPPSFDKNKFWTETFQVATIAKTLAQEAKVLDPETAFTCALIHNIGELLIQSTLPEEAELISLAIQKGSSRVEAQREMLGYDYAQL